MLKEKAFHQALRDGFDFVENGDRLLTLGIKPTAPQTGYGYIQQGQKVDGTSNLFKVKSFTEKPNLELAKIFLASGEFFWNAGIFLWKADSILKAFELHDPETGQLFQSGKDFFATPREAEFIEANFPSAPSNSIDYAIMEKASNVYVETVDLGWSDLGSWKALYETSPHDSEGDVTQNCRVLHYGCKDSIFASTCDDRIIVASGLKDYIVADTPNALLICPVAEEQKIRQIVNDVKDRFGEDFI